MPLAVGPTSMRAAAFSMSTPAFSCKHQAFRQDRKVGGSHDVVDGFHVRAGRLWAPRMIMRWIDRLECPPRLFDVAASPPMKKVNLPSAACGLLPPTGASRKDFALGGNRGGKRPHPLRRQRARFDRDCFRPSGPARGAIVALPDRTREAASSATMATTRSAPLRRFARASPRHGRPAPPAAPCAPPVRFQTVTR